jgi:YD repeat-containing protein
VVGRVTTATNRRGQQVSFTYDGWDRVATRTADGQTTTFSYSPDSSDPNAPWWVAVSNPESTDTVHYDGKGRVTSVTNIRSIGGVTQTYQLVPRYDAQSLQQRPLVRPLPPPLHFRGPDRPRRRNQPVCVHGE